MKKPLSLFFSFRSLPLFAQFDGIPERQNILPLPDGKILISHLAREV